MCTWYIPVQFFLLELFIIVVKIPESDCVNHFKPKVVVTRNKYFDLNINERYPFKPGFAMAPFSSVGEPWPLPKHFKQNGMELLQLQKSTFKISVLSGKSCDILMKAVERYRNIIDEYITEEHYNFPFNFNEETFNERKSYIEQKYKSVSMMPDLEVTVINDHCGYPHINMNESYNLDVRRDVVKLSAQEVWGALRGLETFSQLLFRKQDTEEVYAKVSEITDSPRFPHRGVMIDTARHYIYKNTIKQVLDGMAYNKLNVLHWHIVDDNSFPYKSEVFPKLSEKAAFHPTLVYTLSDIRDIVEYARYRGIRIIPEFDTPGHSFAWFAYPEIVSNCYQGNDDLGPLGPINPAQNKTYEFMGKLFSEIFDIFPEEFVHLGADEVTTLCWGTNPGIKSYMQKYAGIHVETSHNKFIGRTLGYYFERLIPTLHATAKEKKQEKTFILWEDVILNNNKVPPNSVLQIWTGDVKYVNNHGYRVIFSKCWYLDKHKDFHWFDMYSCDPSPYTTEEEKDKVLGGEVCMWTEFVSSDSVMTTLWPRSCLPAERLWSPRETTDENSAASRLQEQRCRMIFRGLPTGQISGPDYCLRHKDRPLENRAQRSVQEDTTRSWRLNTNVKEDKKIGKSVITHHNYLQYVSLSLCVLGMLTLMFAKRRIAKKNVFSYIYH